MIPKHPQFLEALHEQKKVCVRFYSKPDSGVLDRVCAPMDYGPGVDSYGPGVDSKDELNRYWVWDYASDTGSHLLGLVPQQIVDLQVLGEGFDPAQLTVEHSSPPVAQTGKLSLTSVGSPGDAASPKP